MAKSTHFPTPNQTTSLLSDESDNAPPNRNTHPGSNPLIFTALIALSCVGLATSSAFGFLYFTTTTSSPIHVQRTPTLPTKQLPRPVVIMVSLDGFRFGYQFKTPTPNIDLLIKEGVSAERGLIPVYPTLTFPNHYSMVTGLYPAYHGIVNNRFFAPAIGESFKLSNLDENFWLGQPLWETVANHDLPAAVYFWPGAEVLKGKWTCPPKFCPKYKYSKTISFEERVEMVLRNFDLPNKDEIPVLMNLYISSPDKEGHRGNFHDFVELQSKVLVGPDDPLITSTVTKVDALIGKLIAGLESRHLLDEVTIIVVGDHGMVSSCEEKYIYLEDLPDDITIPTTWIESRTPVLSIRPDAGVNAVKLVAEVNAALESGKVTNGDKLKLYLKKDLPKRLCYWESDRIPPIIGMVAEGYTLEERREEGKDTERREGSHGYDNELFSMRTVFFGRGPRFEKGVTVPSFENVELYNMVTEILGINGAPTNGTLGFANSLLLKS